MGKPHAILIEKISIPYILLTLLLYWKVEKFFYIYESFLARAVLNGSLIQRCGKLRKYQKLHYADFPGSENETVEETYERINGYIFDKYCTTVYPKVAVSFSGDPLCLLAIKKELFAHYTQKRVKTYILLKHISGNYQITRFIPTDNEDIAPHLSETLKPDVSDIIPIYAVTWNRFNYALTAVAMFTAIPVLIAGVTAKTMRRGTTGQQITKNHFHFGFDLQQNGLLNERGFDHETSTFFLYDNDQFHPSKIIHMVRSGQRLTTEARKHLEQMNCPYVELDTLKVPVKYAYKRILIDFIGKNFLNVLRFSLSGGFHPICSIPAFATMRMIMEAEIHSEYYDVDVFIARDDYSPYHIARTLVAHDQGNKTVGFQWADLIVHNEAHNYVAFDKFALWGEFYRDFNKEFLGNSSTEIIGANVYGADLLYNLMNQGYIPQKYIEMKKKYKIIALMGTGFGNPEKEDTQYTKENDLKFYRDVLELTDRYDNVFRIIKPKRSKLDNDYISLTSERKRIAIETDLQTYRFLAVPDLIITVDASSVIVESLMAGKKVIPYSYLMPREYNVYSQYDPSFAAFEREELKEVIDRFVERNLYTDDEIIRYIQKRHGYAFDGNVSNRFRAMCIDLLNDAKSANTIRY